MLAIEKANPAFLWRWPCFLGSDACNKLKDITHARGKFIRDDVCFHLFVFETTRVSEVVISAFDLAQIDIQEFKWRVTHTSP